MKPEKKMQNDTAISSCISLCNHHLHEANECFISKPMQNYGISI